MMKTWALGSLVIVGVALAACGGSGNGSGGGGAGPGGSGGTSPVTTANSTSSSKAASTGAGAGEPCGILWDDRPDCELCMESNCCSEMQGCADGTDCDALLDCANACAENDSACVDACVNAHDQGLTDFQLLQQCYSMTCKNDAACVFPICDSPLSFPDQKCAECVGMDAACCQAAKDCDASADCVSCLSDDTLPACATDAPFLTLDACLHDGAQCGKLCTFNICDAGLAYPNAPACNYCLGTSCCAEMNACEDDQTCFDCITGAKEATDPACTGSATLTTFNTCKMTNCDTDC